MAQYTEVMNIERFARHIATHGSVYSRADISAILYMAVDCLRELLLEGKKIRLGDLAARPSRTCAPTRSSTWCPAATHRLPS